MFGFGKKTQRKASAAINKFSGRLDFLQAVAAASALIAAADGDIEDAEVRATTKTIASNPGLASAFQLREIEQVSDQMLKRAQAGRSGKLGLWKEVEDVASDPEMAEVIYVTALDIAESDGEIEPAEQSVLDKLAQVLGVDPRKFEV
ncbi:putative tellurite-resistance protein [Sinorhizobium phage phiM5]|nr:putative tellurite-resistance protein [Sinorhizobium phage phiM5]